MKDYTLEEMFEAYKSCYSNPRMTKEQAEHLQSWHVRRGRTGITLSQVDFWIMHAGLIKKNYLSYTDTGMIFSKFRKFSLNFHEFTAYLETLAEDKHFDLGELKAKFLAVGLP
jgi:hypothetical protein